MPLFFNFTSELGRSRETRWDSNRAHQLLVYADDVDLLGDNTNIIKKNTNL
jgi:hypothetical protein